jgi:hypothetical protein
MFGTMGMKMNAFTSEASEKDVMRGAGGRSIHPRGRGGKSTRGVSTGARQQRSIAALTEHLSRHPGDRQSEAHRSKLAAALAKAGA